MLLPPFRPGRVAALMLMVAVVLVFAAGRSRSIDDRWVRYGSLGVTRDTPRATE